MNIKSVLRISVVLIMCTQIGCSKLIIKPEDSFPQKTVKVTTRILLGCCTIGFSELEIKKTKNHYNLEIALNSWVGSSIDNFISRVGYPDGSSNLPNGNIVYVFGSQTDYGWCKKYIEVDPETKRIITWSYKGNHCY